MMDKKYDFSQIPPSWRFCFNAQCPNHEHCLRFQTALEVTEEWGTSCWAVLSSMLKDGQCMFYRKDEKVTLATGFVVKSNPRVNNMFVEMRHRLTGYLGGNGTYYLYRNGKKWLSPKQQEGIRRIFREAGYIDEVVFNKTKEDYDFT